MQAPKVDPKFIGRNDPSAQRWSATGFMAGGVGAVDGGTHTLKSAVVIRPGLANGHGMWIDKAFCQDVAAKGNTDKPAGLKARFGHPNACSDALGTFLGRWKGLSVAEDGRVVGDLHLSSTAEQSPKGNLRKYVEEMAVKEPLHFGASIVFTRDREAEMDFIVEHGGSYAYWDNKNRGWVRTGKKSDIPEGADWYVDPVGFKSPDPDNGENLPHARCAQLHAADLVDDPAATDGMFSGAAGLSLAGQMTEWLDLHPEALAALQEPGMLELLARYHDRVGPFIERYLANAGKRVPLSNDGPAGAAESAQAAPEPAPAAEPAAAGVPDAATQKLTARIGELETENTRLAGELAGTTQRADTAEASLKATTAERDELAARLKESETTRQALTTELDETRQKVRAYEFGQAPVSAAAAPEDGEKTPNMWADARRKKR